MLYLILQVFSFEKLDWRFSVKSPFYFPKAGDIPFWQSDLALHHPKVLRLANSLVGSKGKLGSEKNPYSNWRAYLEFKISGDYYGGHGLGIFFVEDLKFKESHVLAVSPNLKGVGIIFSSSDGTGLRQNVALVNLDGTQTISKMDDFSKFRVQGCFNNFRNTLTDYRVSIVYKNGSLFLNVGEKGNSVDCFEHKIDIPKNYHILLSAESGQNPDDHDLIKFELYNLDAKPKDKKEPDHIKADDERLAKLERQMEEELHKEKTKQPPIRQGSLDLSSQVASIVSDLSVIRKKIDSLDINSLKTAVDKLQSSMDGLQSSGSSNLGAASKNFKELQSGFSSEIQELKSLIIKLQGQVTDFRHEHAKVTEGKLSEAVWSIVKYLIYFFCAQALLFGAITFYRSRQNNGIKKFV